MKTTNRSLLFVIALSISTVANAAGAMLRVTCEGNNAGASVYINGKLKGECPLDIKVPVGKIKLRVTKAGDEEHGPRVFEQAIYMGEDVAKKIEVQFGEVGLTAIGKQRRYEAELAEYNKNIQACLPRHADELGRLKQAARQAYKSRFNQCINRKSQDISDGMESSGYSRETIIRQVCGHASLDEWDGYFWTMDNDEPPEIVEYRRFNSNASTWCARQFTEPQPAP